MGDPYSAQNHVIAIAEAMGIETMPYPHPIAPFLRPARILPSGQ